MSSSTSKRSLKQSKKTLELSPSEPELTRGDEKELQENPSDTGSRVFGSVWVTEGGGELGSMAGSYYLPTTE
jgi:hypothetical protein